MSRRVAVIVGSLRKESLTRKIANEIAAVAGDALECAFVDIGDLPLYNPDLEASSPSAWTAFRHEVASADAVLFVTPEYNRSIPGGLKNAIDVGSRPAGKGAFTHKPAAVVSVSPGRMSGFGANQHLRQTLVFLDMPTLQQPEMYIGQVVDQFEDDGVTVNEKTRAYLKKFTDAFAKWIEKTM